NTGSNNVMILNGNGDATFQPPVTLSGDAPSPRAIAAADLNKDGRGDLLIGHSDGVDIRLGNGNGSFQPPVRVARGFVATSVASGDFNKDGNPDIAVSSETSSSATILLGNGNGTFGPPGSYVTRAGAGPFFVTDFDSDGNSDVVFGAGHPDGITAAANDSNVTVLYGRGNGTLHAAPSVVLPSLGEFTVGDFNGDGLPDVAATAPLTNGLSNTAGLNLAFNDGNGTLTPQPPIPVPSQNAPAQLSRITSADFNGDGRRDVAVTSGSIVHVLTANGAGGFNAPASFTASSQMTSITAADVNGDNRQDLVFTDEGEDSVSVALGNGNGTFQTRTIMNAGVDPKGAVAADVNGDGRPDLIVVNFGTAGNDSVPGGISVLLGGGSGAFQAAANFAAGLHPTNVTVGDVNLDGRPDIIVSTGGANAATLVAVLPGNGNGTFQTPTLLPAGFGPAQTALTDFNGDGKVDILVGHCCGSVQMGLLLGDGNGAFQTETTIPNTGNGSSFVVVTDMNRDGKPDVVFGANGSPGGYVATLLNVTSTGPLVPTINSPASGTAFGPGSITFSWGAVAGATKYKLEIGSTAGASDLFTQETTNTSLVVSNLPTDGRTLYTRVSAYVNGAYGSAATSIYQAFRTAVALRFVPVVPCRIADTRNATGVFGGPVISGGTTRDFPVPASPCGIPAGAQAYSLSVTVVPRGPLSYLTIWPTGQGQPFVSTLNSFDGRIKANAAIVPSGINGAVSVFVTNTTDVILDINGYFIPASGASNLSFYPLVPCRIADTRNASGQFGGPTMTAGQTRTFNVPQSACNLPSSAQAYSLNFTVVPPAGLSFLTTWPTGQSRPLVSTLNSFTGTVVANAAIVPAGTNGGIDVFVTDNTHVIIDVNGYFAPPGGAGAMSFYTATPCRVADTRLPVGPVGGPSMTAAQTRTFPVPSSSCGIPASAQAYSLNATVVPPANLSFLTLWPAGGAQPNVSTLNSFDGSVVANAAIVPAGVNGGINAFVTHLTDLILDINGYFAP
ncbi:MAG TPA: VCBS repeat-containing protein, partial [Bryobacteraceae bacterium]|nr:VCBS repeat-containing protein [Bryobacteraceae bacterium]